MMSPGETTRDCWVFEGPYHIERSREEVVPARFLKNIIWILSEGGYYIEDPFNKDHFIKVEFCNDTLF